MKGRWFFYLDEDDVELTVQGEAGAVSPVRWRVGPGYDLGVPGLTHAALAAAGIGLLEIVEGRRFRILLSKDAD